MFIIDLQSIMEAGPSAEGILNMFFRCLADFSESLCHPASRRSYAGLVQAGLFAGARWREIQPHLHRRADGRRSIWFV
jgi:hypothetical protein